MLKALIFFARYKVQAFRKSPRHFAQHTNVAIGILDTEFSRAEWLGYV